MCIRDRAVYATPPGAAPCPAAHTPHPAYEPPRIEILEVACEAGYQTSLNGWDETVDITPEDGGTMYPSF